MKRRIVTIALVGLVVLGGIGYLVFPDSPSGAREVYLDPAVIDQAVLESSDKPNWGINLPEITVRKYVPGVTVHAAVVVHQGDDGEGIFTVSTGELWADVQEPSFRLQAMETKVVPISFLMPENHRQPDNSLYEFRVQVNKKQTGMVQVAYEQKWQISLRQ